MVYGRKVGDKELNFEASGALMDASLIMRDRETDSWWSIMTSDSIGGPLDGADLEVLPYSEKETWGEWKAKHPDTVILSVDGVEHELNNPYDNYFESEGTFRDLEISDKRLKPKENIFSFWLDGRPYAVAHAAIEGGGLFDVGQKKLLFYRPAGASFYLSSTAWIVDPTWAAGRSAEELARSVTDGRGEAERLNGFDTFWYNWVAVNENSELLE